MGIGSILKKAVGVAAPIVGGIFGGPLGAAAGGALGSAVNKGGIKGAAAGAITGAISGPAKGASIGAVVKGALKSGPSSAIDMIRGNMQGLPGAEQYGPPSRMSQIGGLLKKVAGVGSGSAGTNDLARTITGTVGSGLGALQQQRQFEAAQKLRQRQLDDDILTSGQARHVSEDERVRKDAEFQRMKKQDAQYSPQRAAIVANLMGRLGVGGGGLT